MTDFRDRVAVVTGASSGIGRACAQLLAERGARVALFARSMEPLLELAAQSNGRMRAVVGNVSDLADVERLFADAESHFGHVDVVINNAGAIDPAPITDMTLEQWESHFAVNARGVFLTTRRALPSMLARGRGTIVNVASISGVLGPEKFPGFAAYCASKAAVISFTEAVAVEVKASGVRINCVSPGSVDTPMWANVSGGAPAAMTPREVAETILFLASDASRPVNGQNLHVFSA